MSEYLTAYTTRKLSRSEANDQCANSLLAGAIKSAGSLAMLGITLAAIKYNKKTLATAFGTASALTAILAKHDFTDANNLARDYALDVDM